MPLPYQYQNGVAVPVVEIHVGAPTQPFALGPITAVIDTGADICVFPAPAVRSLHLPAISYRYLRSPWGHRQRVALFVLDIGLGSGRIPAIEVAANDSGEEFIVGLNLLNKLVLTLDGPRQLLDWRL